MKITLSLWKLLYSGNGREDLPEFHICFMHNGKGVYESQHSDTFRSIARDFNMPLAELVHYVENLEWTLTDGDTRQYGRQLDENLFQFKENGRDTRIINLEAYSTEDVEDAIVSYGYTQHEASNGNVNIVEQYGDIAKWIIAECLFELGQ